MFDLKEVYVKVFRAIRDDRTLLGLLEIEIGEDYNEFLTVLRDRVIDSPNPDDLLNNNATRICIYENPSGQYMNTDVGYIRIDIHITQDKNALDRRVLKIIKRLVEILDTKERKLQGLPRLNIGLDDLEFYQRLPAQQTSYSGWDKYSLLFRYKYIF